MTFSRIYKASQWARRLASDCSRPTNSKRKSTWW